MDKETVSEIKRLEREISFLKEADRRLRERISVASGDSSDTFYAQSSLNGLLTAGDGIDGGGSFPGTVGVDLSTPGTISISTANDPSGNHVHEVSGSSNPGAAASLLESDASGYLQLTRVGAGMNPTQAVSASGYLYAQGDGINTGILSYKYIDDETSSYISLRKARGSIASPAIVNNNDRAAHINVEAHDGVTMANLANIYFKVDGTPGADDMPGRIEIELSPAGSDTTELAVMISSNKHANFYGDVTLEKRCFGFVKAKDANGEISNGPVEFGEVFGIGGTFEVAPSAALNAAVTIN